MEERTDTNLKTFNTAKKYAEDVLFPKMDYYQKFQRQADFGCENLDNSKELSEDIRDIERYNGLKGMNDILHNLLVNISSTVKLKGNQTEIKKLEELLKLTDKIKELFYFHRELFFRMVYKDVKTIEVLDRAYFEKVKNIIDTCYINTEILMTRNKLLFADSNDEYMSDDEIKESIKREYIEN